MKKIQGEYMAFSASVAAKYTIVSDEMGTFLSTHQDKKKVSKLLASFLPKSNGLEADIADALGGIDIRLPITEWEKVARAIQPLVVTKKITKDILFALMVTPLNLTKRMYLIPIN